tara:strand:- start:173 stop:388 length:216 start_codon:yes stop_codon:yes gene_type:complete
VSNVKSKEAIASNINPKILHMNLPSMNQDLKHFITEHCKRIATLQNSQDPNKHALIALLAKEIGQAKEKLA